MVIERIKQIRKRVNMSQQEFGKQLGVSRDVIGNIEYGRVEPKEIFIDHLCHIFSISKDWLLYGTGEMTDEHIESKNNIDEAIKIFEELSPDLQDYALKQIRLIYELQEQEKKESP